MLNVECFDVCFFLQFCPSGLWAWRVRYMSTRDAGEQRSLLRVISTILQLTKQEVASVEERITELEKTMVTT